MLAPGTFLELLQQQGIRFFSGVPDSLLKPFLSCVGEQLDSTAHVIAANEGAAIALAAGHHLATGEVALVYMQNSGLGNAVNPLLSLTDASVYAIPLLLLIGWRGEPGLEDEPQHLTQGRVTPALLEALEIPYRVLSGGDPHAAQHALEAIAEARQRSAPSALLVRRDTFGDYAPQAVRDNHPGTGELTREAALERVLAHTDGNEILVATTGMAARELFELRTRRAEDHARDFLTVGSMGHAGQIALGIARARPHRQVVCLDGDGALLMHLGSLVINAASACRNYKHILLNNGSHDSVGGQPTAGFDVDFPALAQAAGYRWTAVAAHATDIEQCLQELLASHGPALLEIRLTRGHREDLGRPTASPLENKRALMRLLQ